MNWNKIELVSKIMISAGVIGFMAATMWRESLIEKRIKALEGDHGTVTSVGMTGPFTNEWMWNSRTNKLEWRDGGKRDEYPGWATMTNVLVDHGNENYTWEHAATTPAYSFKSDGPLNVYIPTNDARIYHLFLGTNEFGTVTTNGFKPNTP